jgi:hypothetical protein
MFSRFGDPNWWFGKNSIIGKHGGTIGFPGGFSFSSGPNQSTTQQPGQMPSEANILKYVGLGFLGYLILKK